MHNPDRFSGKLIVLIPHYNHPDELEKTILSIDEPFEVDVLVVDDGSQLKPNAEKLKSQYKNGKLFIEFMTENGGIGIALNNGLKKIEELGYALIARLDCGDLNKKNKYLKQLMFLEANPQVKLLGTWADMVDEKGNLLFVLKHPTTHEEIKKKMYLNNRFVHPTVVFYTEILKTTGYYSDKYKRAAQDYDLFFKVIKNFEVANLPESLLTYVIDDKSISTKNRKLQVKNRILIILENFKPGIYPVYSLIRNSMLYFMPRGATTQLKKLIYKR
ncbi:MAG: glycosyltransferase [Weeksellaceae bacterium]